MRATVRDRSSHILLRVCGVLLRLPGHAFRRAVAARLLGWQLGDGVSLERGVRITCRGGVSLGDRTIINRDTLLDGRGGLTIGSDVNVSPEVAVLTAEHDPQSPGFTGRDRAVRIGDRCWLATRVLVLPGTVIDDGCVLAAGAVAHGHLAGDVIYAGNPVRAIRDRSPDAQHDLLPYRRFLQ